MIDVLGLEVSGRYVIVQMDNGGDLNLQEVKAFGRVTSRGRFPRLFGDKFSNEFSESPNLMTSSVMNVVMYFVNHQIR